MNSMEEQKMSLNIKQDIVTLETQNAKKKSFLQSISPPPFSPSSAGWVISTNVLEHSHTYIFVPKVKGY